MIAPHQSPFTSGEVGVLGEENAQRLCSAFSESAFECLSSLASLSGKHGPSSFQQLYIAGLGCVPQWSHDVLKEEVAGLEARYPEAELLYQYCYLSLLADLGEKGGGEEDLNVIIATMPPLSKFYHLFLNRVCASPDVTRGRFFFDQPHAQRRVVFLECFRNALHDIVRQKRSPQAVVLSKSTPRQEGMSMMIAADDNRSVKSNSSNNKAPSSVFKAALVVAAEKNTPPEDKANNSDSEHQEDDDESSSDEKIVQVSASPCFFADESPAAAPSSAA